MIGSQFVNAAPEDGMGFVLRGWIWEALRMAERLAKGEPLNGRGGKRLPSMADVVFTDSSSAGRMDIPFNGD
jgi:hypothetical protein